MEDLRADPLLKSTTEVKGYKVLPPCVVFARIGQGGMGAVYRGHHLNLDIEVAIKCLKPSLVDDDPTFVDRFRREGRSAAKINHQNVIRVFDVAESLGLHYLIMEYVQGETARQRVERKGQLAVPEALQVVYEASLGLGEAHRLGIVHRDIKPDNLLISSRGQVKVADLGLAKPTFGGGQSLLSVAGQVMGTPPYMPPEQWEGGTITAAADVWAMGAVLYYLLAGREAIAGESLAGIMSKIMLEPFPDIRALRPDVSDEVAALLTKATNKAPGERFLDAGELADAIAALPEHRISLCDTDAGTTELRTMLSPPPMPQLDEIKQLLREGTPTRRATAPRVDKTARPATAKEVRSGRGQRLALVVAVLVLGGGAAAWFGWFNEPGRKVTVDPLAAADQMEQAGKYAEALLAAREAYDSNAALPGRDERVNRLLAGAKQAVIAGLQRDVPAAVRPANPALYRGRLVSPLVRQLLLAGNDAVLAADGSFEVERTPDAGGFVTVQVVLTSGDTIDLEPWQVELVAPPLTFVDSPAVSSPLRDGISETADITVAGRLSEAGSGLSVDGEPVADVAWRADGSFEARVTLKAEGRNELAITVNRADATPPATATLTVVRLTRPPELRFVTPDTATLRTAARELAIEVEADDWTASVAAVLDDDTIPFVPVEGLNRWRSKQQIALRAGENRVTVTATNRVGKANPQLLTIVCTAPGPKIESVGIAPEASTNVVENGGTRYVRGDIRILVGCDPKDAQLVVDDDFQKDNPFLVRLTAEGQQRVVSLQARIGRDTSAKWQATFVLDKTRPTVQATQPTAVPPDAVVDLLGTWSDNTGVESIELVRAGVPDATIEPQPGTRPGSGSWATRLQAGRKDEQVTIRVIDLAGNIGIATTDIRVTEPVDKAEDKPPLKPAVLEPDPLPAEEPKPEPKVITFPGFERIANCKVNARGYPEELRHQKSGLELVAINFKPDGKPAFYVAKTMVTDRQWDGQGAGEAKVSISGRTILADIRTRLPGLDLPNAVEWDAITKERNAKVEAIDKGLRELLAPSSMVDSNWPVRKDAGTTSARDTSTSAYRGFRVVLRL